MIGYLAQILLFPLPWGIRRRLLNRMHGYRISPGARIGFSVVRPGAVLEMETGARIGHLNFIRGMKAVRMAGASSIGHLNWIYGIPESQTGRPEHRSELAFAEGAKLTHRHLVDCTGGIDIGRFALIAGYRSQLLTHSIDIVQGVQRAREITIGELGFVGTGAIVLGGSRLPHHSVLGAGSVLRTAFEQPYRIYSGTPAVEVAPVAEDAGFFTRTEPYVDFG